MLAEKYQYDCNSWWSLISNEPVSSKNSIVSILNPTLSFLAKWLAKYLYGKIQGRNTLRVGPRREKGYPDDIFPIW